MNNDHPALDELAPLSPDELYRQWVLTPEGDDGVHGWRKYSLHGWQLSAHPDAYVCELLSAEGDSLGWLLEPLAYLSADGGIVPKKKLTLPVSKNSDVAEFERAFYGRDSAGYSDGTGIMGPWVAIIIGGPGGASISRVYLGASHSIVYHPQKRVVATSHNLVPGIQRNEELSLAYDCLNRKSYFSFGLTAFQSLYRLLPNHYLDLDTFLSERHWPSGALKPKHVGKEGAAAMVDHERRFLDALSSEYNSFKVFASAGRDSRAVLSMLRPFVADGADVILSTSVGSDLESQTDLYVARRLARITGLPHEVKRNTNKNSGNEDYMRRGFVRIGEAASSPGLFSSPGVHQRKPFDSNARFNLAGMGGETGRGPFWKKGVPSEPLTPEFLMEKVKAPLDNAEVKAATTKWLNEIPSEFREKNADVLDLAYIEQRMGCWQAPMSYLSGGMINPGGLSRQSTSPMAEAFCYETMLRLPVEYRAAGVLQRDMVAYGWPELLSDIPFNEPTRLLRLRRFISRSVKNPRVIFGAIRSRLS
ncbi:hypothetical protein [Rhodohalobacter sp. 8-1]|uniref:hypothetical protein n=1 Tax=Rhodohalobacter sp. 8-1 TaxID=3131972 RepID=UPI0030EF4065